MTAPKQTGTQTLRKEANFSSNTLFFIFYFFWPEVSEFSYKLEFYELQCLSILLESCLTDNFLSP